MRRRIPLPFAATFGVLAAVACTNPGWVCGCLTAPPYAIVTGRVTTDAGAPVPGAGVYAEAGNAACASPVPIGQAVTGDDGRYQMAATPLAPLPAGACLRVYAAPPGGLGPARSDTVRFTASFSATPPIDSVRIDLVLRTP